VKAFRLLRGVMLAGLCLGAVAAADLSIVAQWADKYPSDKIVDAKPLWDQPAVKAAMRAVMGNRYFRALRDMHGPEGPMASDGKNRFAAWFCKSHDCGGNQLTVFFDSSAGNAQVCWRSRSGAGDGAQDLWLANGKARPLPVNACGYSEKNPFSSLKKFGTQRQGASAAVWTFAHREGSLKSPQAGALDLKGRSIQGGLVYR
jgi:hypothetical protein